MDGEHPPPRAPLAGALQERQRVQFEILCGVSHALQTLYHILACSHVIQTMQVLNAHNVLQKDKTWPHFLQEIQGLAESNCVWMFLPPP